MFQSAWALQTNALDFEDYYWTSCEPGLGTFNGTFAYQISYTYGIQASSELTALPVRAIRAITP